MARRKLIRTAACTVVFASGLFAEPVRAQVVIDMPAPPADVNPSNPAPANVNASPGDIDVGTVALARFARIRHNPADTYFVGPLRSRTYRQYRHNYGYAYGSPYGCGYGSPWWGWWGGGVRYNVQVTHVRPQITFDPGLR